MVAAGMPTMGNFPHQANAITNTASRTNNLFQRPPAPPPYRGASSATAVDLSLGDEPSHIQQGLGLGGQIPMLARGTAIVTAIPRPAFSPTVSGDTVSYQSASSQIRDEEECTSLSSATSGYARNQGPSMAKVEASSVIMINHPTKKKDSSRYVIDLSDY